MFFIVMALVLGAIHIGVWWRFARATQAPRWARIALAVALSTLFTGLFTVWGLSRTLPRAVMEPATFAVFFWLGTLFYLGIIRGLLDLPVIAMAAVRGVRRIAGKLRGNVASGEQETPPADLSRRVFMARVASGVTVAATGGIVALGARSALTDITLPEIEVKLARWPKALDGYRIALISDTHLGPMLGERFARQIMEQTNALKPDLIAVTGDMVDGPVNLIGRDLAPLGDLRARHGVHFITGNHEYYSGVEEWLPYFRSLGWRVLENERIAIRDGDATYDLAGVHDEGAGQFYREHIARPEQITRGRDENRELILLAHRPSHIDIAEGTGAGLQLSGHTHGGQLWPFGILTGLAQPYLKGLHRHDRHTQIYVSCGTGFWGPPMRVAAPPEISTIVLTAA